MGKVLYWKAICIVSVLECPLIKEKIPLYIPLATSMCESFPGISCIESCMKMLNK